MKETKKVYDSPELTVHGGVEDLTLGSGFGINDIWVFGLSDVIGNCGNNSCNTGS
jgi:hypothetical protein